MVKDYEMFARASAMIVLITLSGMTIAEDLETDLKELESELADELTPEQLERLYEFLEEEDRAFVMPPKALAPSENQPEYSGEWIERDGVRECDGYLTRIEGEDYCRADIPTDWQPFEFNGKTFFVQPLTDDGS